MKKTKKPRLKSNKSEIAHLQSMTRFIAMSVRNEMEDFHCEHLSDKQMKELNPIIRKGIFCALLSIAEAKKGSHGAREWSIENQRMAAEEDQWEDSPLPGGLFELHTEADMEEWLSRQSL